MGVVAASAGAATNAARFIPVPVVTPICPEIPNRSAVRFLKISFDQNSSAAIMFETGEADLVFQLEQA